MDLLRKPQIHTQSSRIAQPNPRSIAQAKQLGHPQKRSHNRSRAQSCSTFCGKEPRTIAQQSSSPIHSNEAQSIAQSRTHTPSLQATMVNHRGFVATYGRAALRALSIVGLLPRMAEIWLRNPRGLCVNPRLAQQNLRIRGLCSKSSDPMFACVIAKYGFGPS